MTLRVRWLPMMRRTSSRCTIGNIRVGDDAHIVPLQQARIWDGFRVGRATPARRKRFRFCKRFCYCDMIKNLHPSVGSRRAVTGMAFPVLEMPDNFAGSCTRADVGIGPYVSDFAGAFCGQCPANLRIPARGRAMPAPTRRSRVFENACTRPRRAVALRVRRFYNRFLKNSLHAGIRKADIRPFSVIFPCYFTFIRVLR